MMNGKFGALFRPPSRKSLLEAEKENSFKYGPDDVRPFDEMDDSSSDDDCVVKVKKKVVKEESFHSSSKTADSSLSASSASAFTKPNGEDTSDQPIKPKPKYNNWFPENKNNPTSQSPIKDNKQILFPTNPPAPSGPPPGVMIQIRKKFDGGFK